MNKIKNIIEYFKNLDLIEKILISSMIFITIITLLIPITLSINYYTRQPYAGTVIDKYIEPPSTTYALTKIGDSTVMMPYHNSESFIIILDDETPKHKEVSVNHTEYYKIEIGQYYKESK